MSEPLTAIELREGLLEQARAWRWDSFPSLALGDSPWDGLRGSDETHRTKALVELIDLYDIAIGTPEPDVSLKLRARRQLERYNTHGIDEGEAEKLLEWLGSAGGDQ